MYDKCFFFVYIYNKCVLINQRIANCLKRVLNCVLNNFLFFFSKYYL